MRGAIPLWRGAHLKHRDKFIFNFNHIYVISAGYWYF